MPSAKPHLPWSTILRVPRHLMLDILHNYIGMYHSFSTAHANEGKRETENESKRKGANCSTKHAIQPANKLHSGIETELEEA